MGDSRGTDDVKPGCSDWFELEAECSDIENDLEKLFEDDTDSNISGLIDDGDVIQGNSHELFHLQECEENEQQLQFLKRKYFSPLAVQQLSPRLQSITISPEHKSKRRLFVEQDSGVDLTQNEVEDIPEEEVEVPTDSVDNVPAPAVQEPAVQGVRGQGSLHYKELLKTANVRSTMLGKFKTAFDCSFTELTRQYKSNKTCCRDWVTMLYGVRDELLEASKQLLQQHCSYIWLSSVGAMTLYLLSFNSAKSRDTLHRLLMSILDVHELQLISEPPRLRSMAAALFWYRGSMGNAVYAFGAYPDWIVRQTMLNHHTGECPQFDLSTMVQWAYDNDYVEEADIAYNYAKLADEDANARAWLSSNSQAKFVRECAQMVRHYKRGEMRDMSMSCWIHKCLKRIEGDGSWADIVKFIRFQNINFIIFLDTFKRFLKSVPKQNTLLIWGPPDTGKSTFSMSLLKALKGRVLSFVNSRSQFWLQPVAECKIALLDDATDPAWTYIDTFLRNGLDGNCVSIDCKHRAPTQVRFPPLLITSNYNIMVEDRYRYLHSRIRAFEFPNKFPFKDDGTPQFNLTDQSWKSFFRRLWSQLDLSDQEDEGDDGDSQRTFSCTARETNGNI
ncbi:E1 [Macaca fascicularis papillomavirus 2]|uniref:Replication protein E1 n=1 Tax=Macaca fascicularis papillomavirus 2 TaxID=915424 RepID=F8QPP6_9PAPI|nr:E1 [Macaca fascicularis papillomavirus 2]ADQ39301.1 E1 [Macaca fascicularis papillomavirus 2]